MGLEHKSTNLNQEDGEREKEEWKMSKNNFK